MKNRYKIFLLSVTLTFASCGGEEPQVSQDVSPAISVEVRKVSNQGSNQFLAVSGKIQATNSANLSTRMMGYVTEAPVGVGDKVRKGQLLIAINNTDLQAKRAQVNAQITEVTAAFKNAEKDYNRFKNLFEDRSASQKELDDMTAHYEMAKARLEAAKQMRNEVNAQFAYANITAPFAGVVTSKTVKKGDMANPGMPLIALEAPGDFEAIAMVPETEISQVETGTQVQVDIKSMDTTIPGKVMQVSPSADQTGGQYMVKIALDKTEASILSGMYVTVQFPVAKTTTQTVMLPKSALVHNGQLSGVYTVSQSNTAILRWLRLGRTFGDQIEVLAGLKPEERYILSAEGKLYNGATITIQ